MSDIPETLDTAAIEPIEDDAPSRPALAENPAAYLEVGDQLAEGGMGRIHNAADALLERSHVIKLLRPPLRNKPGVVRSFLEEARLTASLDHPAVVPVYTLGSRPDTGPFFTMKRIEGRTLMDVLRNNPKRPLPREVLLDILEVVVKVCDALSMAHSRGVLHLDVKPSNIMIGDHGEVYLLDWGMARRTNAEHTPGAVRGTPGFMSPEQARGERPDERADVFAMAAVLYHVLTRRPPFWRRRAADAIELAKRGAMRPLHEAAREAPPALVSLVERALVAARDDRTASIATLRDELRAFIRGDAALPHTRVPAGTVVMRQGRQGRSAWIIHSGRCTVQQTQDGVTRTLREMGPGEIFGELSLLTGAPASATVRAAVDSELIEVTADTFERELSSMSPWMRTLVRLLAERFRARELAGQP